MRARVNLSTLVAWVFGLVALAFGVVFVSSRWDELSGILTRLEPTLLTLSILVAVSANLAAVLAWRAIWPGFGVSFAFLASVRYFFVSQVGKYIPGSVWTIAAQAKMTSQWAIPVRTSVVVGLIALAVSIAVALTFGSASVVFLGEDVFVSYWWVALLAVAFGVALTPPILTALVRLGLRLLRRPGVDSMHLAWGRTARIAALNAVYWLFMGVHFWLILLALGADPTSSFVPALAGFAVSFALGVLFIPAPAGLGVREVALVLFLSSAVGDIDAIAAALVSRVALAVVDFGLAGVGVLVPMKPGYVVVRDGAAGSAEDSH